MDDFTVQRYYWRQVAESEGFDIENVSIPYGTITGLMPYDCQQTTTYPYSVLVNLYAQLGLHQKHLKMPGRQYEFVSLLKFNMLQNLVSSFYMTLLVRDLSTLEEKEFQVRIDERIYGSLYVACTVARFKDEVMVKSPFVPHFHAGKEIPDLPNWLPDDLMEMFTLDESSRRSPGFDCTYLYLKLVVCAHDRFISEEVLSKLEIVSVAVIPAIPGMWINNIFPHLAQQDIMFDLSSVQDVKIFLVFKGLAIGEIGEDAEHKAVISRVFNGSGYMSLRGKLL